MCFCNRVGGTIEPEKEAIGEWGGVICGTGNSSGGIAKGPRVVETEDLEGTIEVASTRDGAYEASGGRREEAVPRSVGISRDKR
jgi:hypothetical protein